MAPRAAVERADHEPPQQDRAFVQPHIEVLLRTESGYRLRVAIDQPIRSNTWNISVIDPSGNTAASGSTSNSFSTEVFVPAPAAGRYTIHVVPSDGDADHLLSRRRAQVLARGGDAAAQPLGRLGTRR